jgi:hypothetical protein
VTPDEHKAEAERQLHTAHEHFNENPPDMAIAEMATRIAQVHATLATLPTPLAVHQHIAVPVSQRPEADWAHCHYAQPHPEHVWINGREAQRCTGVSADAL